MGRNQPKVIFVPACPAGEGVAPWLAAQILHLPDKPAKSRKTRDSRFSPSNVPASDKPAGPRNPITLLKSQNQQTRNATCCRIAGKEVMTVAKAWAVVARGPHRSLTVGMARGRRLVGQQERLPRAARMPVHRCWGGSRCWGRKPPRCGSSTAALTSSTVAQRCNCNTNQSMGGSESSEMS